MKEEYTKLNVKNLGQVFTPPRDTVFKIISLIKNSGRILEPSCGNGAFSDNLKNRVAIELDAKVAPDYTKVIYLKNIKAEN